MEIFLITVVLSMMIVCLCLQVIHFTKIWNQNKQISDTLSRVCDVLVETTEKLRYLDENVDSTRRVVDGIDRSLLALKESQEAAKPMKSNNWDSVREAFKGPVRVEVNERN